MSLPPTPIPTTAHRVAADRCIRLAAHEGTVETLAFYDSLPPGERRVVFALLARAAAAAAGPVGDTVSEVWTDDELRRCHSLFVQGYRSEWIRHGHRLYMRVSARRVRGTEAEGLTTMRRSWTPAEDEAVMAYDRPADRVLAERLDRSLSAIKDRRARLRRLASVSA